MTTLHLVGGPSAAESLRVALDGSAEHADEAVAWFPDDLSCGPLIPDDPAAREHWAEWWDEMVTAQTGAPPDPPMSLAEELAQFWDTVAAAERLVVWYGRDNAGELSFFHALCDRLPDRPLEAVELLGAAGAYAPEELARYLPRPEPVTADERAAARHTWQRITRENQTFRIVAGELTSAPADHYDKALLDAAAPDWTVIARVVAPVMAARNVGDAPLFWRVKALVDSGALLADGNPWLVRQTKIKRP
ncbi:DUF3658 domain-containing protein [Nocardia concava]|uniref:DUF3658 domain-containing protein n=1 Tax=Nocardia concava TaxID=257281 RepID=UPI000684C18D|nr:DUF3658 domain-containing protein [Nocardia concava]